MIYPNPSNGDFIIYNVSKQYAVTIYNLIGQVVFEENNKNNSALSVTNLPKGMYLVKITDESHTVFKKIIIN